MKKKIIHKAAGKYSKYNYDTKLTEIHKNTD